MNSGRIALKNVCKNRHKGNYLRIKQKYHNVDAGELLPQLHLLIGFFSKTSWVSQYQNEKTCLDLNEARDYGGFGMAVASAGPYANNLHLTADR